MIKKTDYFLKLILNERGETDSFRTMMVSLNMLLLAFFIALNSIAVLEEGEMKKLMGSLKGSFKTFSGGINPSSDDGGSITPPGTMPLSSEESISSLLNKLEKFALNQGLGKGFGIQHDGDLTIMTFTDQILFEPGVVVMQTTVEPLLRQIYVLFKDKDYQVRFRGHSDNSSHPPPYRSNREFSVAKAVILLRFFTDRLDLSPARVSVVGYGDTRPLYPNDTQKNRERNHRVEIVFGKEM